RSPAGWPRWRAGRATLPSGCGPSARRRPRSTPAPASPPAHPGGSATDTVRHAPRSCDGGVAAMEPSETGDRDGEPGQARELGHPERAEPEAVQAQGLDREAPDRVEPDVAEEQGPRALAESGAKHLDEHDEDHEIPQRLVEERGVEELELGVALRAMRRRDVELPRQRGGAAERLLVEEIPPTTYGLSEGD